MPNWDAEYIILGAGLTGLSAAMALKQAGKNVLLLEKNAQAGGVIQSQKHEGYRLDFGANTTAYTPDIQQLVAELNLEDQLLFAEQAANTRYLCRNRTLHKVYPSPAFILSTKLLSLKGKWQLIREPFRQPLAQKEESVAAFFTRRLGQEAYTYLVEPVLGGIYAGNPAQMSMEAVMPKLQIWEQEHGSLFRGMIAARKQAKANGEPSRRICSFREGMQQLPQAMAQFLGDAIQFGVEVISIKKEQEIYSIHVVQHGKRKVLRTPQLIWTLPAHAGQLLTNVDQELADLLTHISYVPMSMLFLGYSQPSIGRKRDGFGFLVPSAESQSLLGAICNSAIFPNRAPDRQEVFTLFVGGGRKKADESTIQEAQTLFEELMQISSPPIFQHVHQWQQAIPQYGLQHMKIRNKLQEAEMRNPGLRLLGNFREGVSVGDCIAAGTAIALTQERY